jgi:heme exporter protein D
MTWGSVGEFFAMGGYGLYVWGSYAVTALCMAADALLAARRRLKARQEAAGARPDDD